MPDHMLLMDKGWGDCMDRDKTETSPTYFQDPVTYQSKNSEMKSGIGRKLTTVQRYTFRVESKFSKRESHHCITDSLIYAHTLVEEKIILELR